MSILMGTLAIAVIMTTGRMTYYGEIRRSHRPQDGRDE